MKYNNLRKKTKLEENIKYEKGFMSKKKKIFMSKMLNCCESMEMKTKNIWLNKWKCKEEI